MAQNMGSRADLTPRNAPASLPAAGEPAVSVLVADDDPLFRRLVAAVIEREATLELVGAAADAHEAITLSERLRPQVVLVDVAMPGGGGPHAAREIRARSPGTSLLALSGSDERGAVLEMLRAGAIGYLVKGEPNATVVEAIHRAAVGQGELSPQVTAEVLHELGSHLAREEDAARCRADQLARIERVLREDLVTIAYQPIVDLRTRRPRGVEALARFPLEPLRGPAHWFAEAAAVGLLVELEVAAIRAALRGATALPPELHLTFNASPATVVSPQLAAVLEPYAGARLILEITEHAPVDDYDEIGAALAGLREKGVRLAIDDAGAGFASLRHILLLAPDMIKVDMTLTRGIEADRPKRALARALISFASDIGATIVAEGIESASEASALWDLGVRFGQGYDIGRPGPLDAALPALPRR